MVPVGERAGVGVRGEVGPQPLLLHRPGGAAHDRAVRVERDEVPRADVEAVVPLRRIAREGAEVLVVARGVGGVVLVVAGNGLRARPDATPRRVVRGRVLRVRAVLVLVVAERQHGRVVGTDELVRRRELATLRSGALAAVVVGVRRVTRDVAGGRDLRVGRRRRVVVQDRADAGSVCDGRPDGVREENLERLVGLFRRVGDDLDGHRPGLVPAVEAERRQRHGGVVTRSDRRTVGRPVLHRRRALERPRDLDGEREARCPARALGRGYVRDRERRAGCSSRATHQSERRHGQEGGCSRTEHDVSEYRRHARLRPIVNAGECLHARKRAHKCQVLRTRGPTGLDGTTLSHLGGCVKRERREKARKERTLR